MEPDVYAFSRGEILVVVTCKDGTVHITIRDHPYHPGDKVTNVLNAGETFQVASDGELAVTIEMGEPLLLRPNKEVIY